MIKKLLVRAVAVAALLTGAMTQVHAQLRVEIAGVGAQQIPIAVAGFADEGIAPQQVSAIIKADLERSGMFKVMDAGVMSDASQINYGDWKARGARPHPWGGNHLKPLGEALAKLDAICGVCGA